ncbi:MAG: glycoside hydrolase family 27 protein [Gammaproteobacteria bacterium]|nr:glycoside hydrolase family 27 protein [Gammaproteobacteria bacterium]
MLSIIVSKIVLIARVILWISETDYSSVTGYKLLRIIHRGAVVKKTILLLVSLLAGSVYAQKFEHLAMTPPMGWNSWNHFACNVNEKLIRETADAMVSSGMKDAGYQYVNIDDCWQGERDELGFIQPDSKRFPSGMKALADYVHSKGLKLGIYSDAGWKTCGGYPGSRGYEYQDALTYAKWGIDYLKYDWCNTEDLNAKGAYMTMRNALYAAGRPIVFSVCEWGDNDPWLWGKDVGHLWRTTGDIYPCWDCEYNHGSWSSWGVLRVIEMREGIREYAGPGHWNDPDMMEIGNGMTVNEDRAHFSMWAMLAAPLIAGNDIRNMSTETLKILTNRGVISIDQDKLGIQAFKHFTKDYVDVWFKPLDNGDWAVTFLNRDQKPKNISFNWKREDVMDELSKRNARFDKAIYKIRDLWAHEDLGTTKEILNTKIPGHTVLMLRLIKQ